MKLTMRFPQTGFFLTNYGDAKLSIDYLLKKRNVYKRFAELNLSVFDDPFTFAER